MLTCYTNDSNMTSITNISGMHETINDLNGGEKLIDQLELFTVGYACSTIELVAATQWAREVTGNDRLIGIASNSDFVYNDSFNIVIFDGIGGVREYCDAMGMQEIFDYYPINNLTESVKYYEEKIAAQRIVHANNQRIS